MPNRAGPTTLRTATRIPESNAHGTPLAKLGGAANPRQSGAAPSRLIMLRRLPESDDARRHYGVGNPRSAGVSLKRWTSPFLPENERKVMATSESDAGWKSISPNMFFSSPPYE